MKYGYAVARVVKPPGRHRTNESSPADQKNFHFCSLHLLAARGFAGLKPRAIFGNA
jgi:hypothetical protein